MYLNIYKQTHQVGSFKLQTFNMMLLDTQVHGILSMTVYVEDTFLWYESGSFK